MTNEWNTILFDSIQEVINRYWNTIVYCYLMPTVEKYKTF